MDFYEEASLVMVPSGYKDQKVYSSVPDDGSGDLTFSRASTATRVNSDGYIEKAQVNLLLQSNSFDTTWTLNTATLTGGQSGYDGTSDAWELNAAASGSYVNQNISHSGVHTFSSYVKAGSIDYVLFLTSGGGNSFFNLSGSGSVGTSSGLIKATIESVGGGWFRCSIAQSNAITSVRLYPANSGGTAAGTIYIQDAQLNYGLVAQDYIETTTASITEGVAIDVPRLNYDPANPTSASLLLEPSRTNLIAQSEYLSGSFWFDDDITKEPNTSETLSPEGVYNAIKLTETATNARHRLASNTLTISNATYTASVFLKKGTARYGFIHLSGANAYTIVVDLEQGVITDTATNSTIAHQSVEDYGNGWYRCSVAGNMASVTTAYVVQFGTAGSATPSYNNYVPTFLGSTSNNIYAFGAGMELGSYPTSYIPTYGTSATRTADDMDTTFASAFATDGGATLFYEIDGTPPSGTNATGAHYAIYFSSNDYISYNRSGGGIHRVRVNANSVANYFQTGVDSTDTVKICASVTASNATVYANGVLVNSVSITGSWASATNLVTTINDIIGSIPVKQLILFPTALTATQLAELTTL